MIVLNYDNVPKERKQTNRNSIFYEIKFELVLPYPIVVKEYVDYLY
jgi:hypothetical protein